MSQVRAARPSNPIQPVVPRHRARAHHPVNQQRPVPPRILPILQAPSFPYQSDHNSETKKEAHQHDPRYTNHSTTSIDHQRTKKPTQQITIQNPTYIPHQNYPKQPLSPNRSTRPVRSSEQKYPSHLHINH